MLNFYDTSTEPTPAMMAAMAHAELGDDVYHTDPTVNELERLGAAMLGHQDAVFMPTGTMSNLSAVLAAADRGTEVIAEADSHIVYYEAGGLAAVAGRHAADDTDWRRHSDRRAGPRPICASLTITTHPQPWCAWRTLHNRAGGTVTDVATMSRAARAVRRARPAPARRRGADLQRSRCAGRRRSRAIQPCSTRCRSASARG